MRESSIYAGWHMAGSPRRKRRRPPHPVPHFRTRPQSCDPDVITSQTILPLFVFPARPAPHAHPIPGQIWANIPTWNPATGLNTAVLTYSRPGRAGVARGFATVATACASPARRSQVDHSRNRLPDILPSTHLPPSSFLSNLFHPHTYHVRHKGDAQRRDKASHL